MFVWFINRFSGVLKRLLIFPCTNIIYCNISVVQRFTFLFDAESSLKPKKIQQERVNSAHKDLLYRSLTSPKS